MKDNKWHNENDYYHYHHQKGHTTGKCRILQHKVQDLIDQRRLQVDNPLAIPNQNLEIYQNPLPSHQANTITSYMHQSQVVHKGL